MLTTCKHPAIVRRSSNGKMQYLEMQGTKASKANGWHNLTDSCLIKRFGV